jgi:hypothetical protein
MVRLATSSSGSLLKAVVDLDGLLDIVLEVGRLLHLHELVQDLVLEPVLKLVDQRLVGPGKDGSVLLELGGVLDHGASLPEASEVCDHAAEVLGSAESGGELGGEEVEVGQPCRGLSLVAVRQSPRVGVVLSRSGSREV